MLSTLMGQLVVKYNELKTRDEAGQGLVEYALILVLISLVAITFMTNVGQDIVDIFTDADSDLETPAAS